MKTKEWKRCVFLLILFMLLLMLAMFYGFTFIEGNTQFAAADEVFPTYELKILMNDGQYYWVAKDSCDANEGCNAKEECKILSSTPVKLTVNSPFNYANFVSEFKNGVGYTEGMHFSKFTFIANNQTCLFASNVVLYLGESSVYEIRPNYEKENYNIIFDGNNGDLSYNFATYRYGDDFVLPEASRIGYTFSGWKYEDGTVLNESTVVPDLTPGKDANNENIVLKAQWRQNVYQVSFYDGDLLLKTKSVYYNSIIGQLPTVADNGYAFISFRLKNSNKDYLYDTKMDVADNIELYAYRSSIPTEYSINYNGNGGEITNATIKYNVTQLPLTLQFEAYREFDTFDKLTLNDTSITNDNGQSILATGTLGNINLTAHWKAVRLKTSSNLTLLSETYDQEYVILDCTQISSVGIRQFIIKSSVKEIAFVGSGKSSISKYITVEERSTPLTIHLKNISWSAFFNCPFIDARQCRDLTLHCLGTNTITGGGLLATDDGTGTSNASAIICRNLRITGENLSIYGNNASGGLAGGNGITAAGDKSTLYMAIIDVEIDYLYVKGGTGSSGDEDSINGAKGGCGIVCWVGVQIAPGSEVHILGGDGGEPYEGGVAGERGDDILGGISGAYYGSDGYVPAKEN